MSISFVYSAMFLDRNTLRCVYGIVETSVDTAVDCLAAG